VGRVGIEKVPDTMAQDGSDRMLASRTIISAGWVLGLMPQLLELRDYFFFIHTHSDR